MRRNGYTAPGCAIWKQLAQDRAHNAAVEETWKRENAARERAQQKAADKSMKRYAADKAAQDAHPPWGGFWYIHGSVAGGCEDVSFVFRHRDKSMGSPLEYGAYLKSNGTLAFDRTTYDAAGHVATYTYVTVSGQKYFGSLAALNRFAVD